MRRSTRVTRADRCSNEQGEVIGVNSQIASDAASVAGSQPGSTGVGFAISSNTVAQAIKTIESGKGVSSASASRRRGASPKAATAAAIAVRQAFAVWLESRSGEAEAPTGPSRTESGSKPVARARSGRAAAEPAVEARRPRVIGL